MDITKRQNISITAKIPLDSTHWAQRNIAGVTILLVHKLYISFPLWYSLHRYIPLFIAINPSNETIQERKSPFCWTAHNSGLFNLLWSKADIILKDPKTNEMGNHYHQRCKDETISYSELCEWCHYWRPWTHNSGPYTLMLEFNI